ncbi:aldo/keto reductase [Actinoplanes sp. NPDC049118]|uniref:aldo/keto reductase n=1 Tax=Actinoplanes sp. NPDC049118 TaxID=3155769 RepID=UPI0034032C32
MLLIEGVAGRGQATHAAATHREVTVRTIGHTGEQLPAIGLGAMVGVDKHPAVQRAHLRDVLKAYWEAGGRVIDTSRLNGDSELLLSEVATALGIAGSMFLTQNLWPAAGDLSESRMSRQLQASEERLRRKQIDVLQVADLADVEAAVPMLGRWKSAGRVRYVGVSHQETRYFPAIEILMRNFDIDVIRIRYSILTRLAEEHILPLAAERGIPVLVTMPLETGRLHKLVEGHQVPGWAIDFGATTWAQFFLKYVLSHPAVTVVLPSAGNPAHVQDNMTALRGPLPDDDQRARMVEHMAGFTGFAQLERGAPGLTA